MKTISYRNLFFVTLGIIEYLALTPQHIEIIESFWDKQNHFFAFLVLYVLIGMAYRKLSTLSKIAFLTFIAFQIEATQYFIPGRFFSLSDIVADAVGIIPGILIWRFLAPRLGDENALLKP